MGLNLAGFRDLWGKKLGQMIGGVADDLSPIALNQAQGMRKYFQSAREVPLGKKWEAYQGMGERVRGARQAAVDKGMAEPYRISDYFSGRNVEDVPGMKGGSKRRFRGSKMVQGPGGLSESVRNRRMAWRLGIPGAVAGAAGAQAIFGDNPITQTIGTAGMIAGIGAGTSMMARFGGNKGAFAALGILGVSGVNAARRGDQIGPF